jgi:plasmid stabilization system protein ParE
MKYTVLWTRNAEDKLARIWTTATDRDPVSTAANAIDTALGRSAADCGESRTGDRRNLYEPPLAVIFRVFEADRKVLVLNVWRYTRRPKP